MANRVLSGVRNYVAFNYSSKRTESKPTGDIKMHNFNSSA